MNIGAVEDHRNREGGTMVYPVYSRRSGGLSIGINLFPDRKCCSFDCPYCEVFPFETDIAFDLALMKAALGSAIRKAREEGIPVRDICFSGNGEPVMSENFLDALETATALRDKLIPGVRIVLITNGSGLLDPAMFEALKSAAAGSTRREHGLHIWLKLDAATEDWYIAINRPDIPYVRLLSGIREFAASGTPFTIQTMICTVEGTLPPPEESAAWVRLVTELARSSLPEGSRRRGKPGLQGVQIYGKARPSPEDPLARAAPAALLEERAKLLRAALAEEGISMRVRVYV